MALNDEELNRRREERKRQKALQVSQLRWLKWGAVITAVILVLCGAAVLITNGIVQHRQKAQTQMQITEPTVVTEPTETTAVTDETEE